MDNGSRVILCAPKMVVKYKIYLSYNQIVKLINHSTYSLVINTTVNDSQVIGCFNAQMARKTVRMISVSRFNRLTVQRRVGPKCQGQSLPNQRNCRPISPIAGKKAGNRREKPANSRQFRDIPGPMQANPLPNPPPGRGRGFSFQPRIHPSHTVIPAKAGIQRAGRRAAFLKARIPGFRPTPE